MCVAGSRNHCGGLEFVGSTSPTGQLTAKKPTVGAPARRSHASPTASAAADAVGDACDRRAGAPTVGFLAVSCPVGEVEPTNSKPPQWFRLPATHMSTYPGEPGELRVPAQHQVAKRAPSQVGGGDAMTHVPACPTQATAAVQVHGRTPVPRYSQDPGPRVLDRDIANSREVPPQGPRQLIERCRAGLTPVVPARAVTVGNPPATNGDPVVGGALDVAEGVRLVADELCAPPPDLLPGWVRDGRRDQHAAVHG